MLLDRARRLSSREWIDLARAEFALVEAELLLRLRERGHLLTAASMSPETISAEAVRRAGELGLAVRRAVRYGPVRSKCLARSVALQRLLERARIAGSRIRIGVRQDRGEVTAHAWVTLGDRVIGDDPSFVRRFTEILDARLAGFA